MRYAVWHGSTDEITELMAAFERNNAQRALLDQRFLDGLLFARWIRQRLMAEEHGAERVRGHARQRSG